MHGSSCVNRKAYVFGGWNERFSWFTFAADSGGYRQVLTPLLPRYHDTNAFCGLFLTESEKNKIAKLSVLEGGKVSSCSIRGDIN
jgi:hypothetical protein